jgi:23S rRNA (uracil1939-C5)-methyltransferase
MTAFVPFLAPGEVAKILVEKQSKRFLEGDVTEITETAPERVVPPCPYFGECGGCDLQHIEYSAQLAHKREMVIGAFRAGGFAPEVLACIAPVVSGKPYGYRQRVALHTDNDGKIGYYRRRSHALLPVVDCPIAVDPIREFLAKAPELPKGFGKGTLYIEATDTQVFGSLRLESTAVKSTAPLLRRLEGWFTGASVEAGRIVEESGFSWAESPRVAGEFAQANAEINEALVSKVRHIAQEGGAKTAYDLYAGSGNFALPLAGDGVRTTAVEISTVLVSAGRSAARQRGVANSVQFRAGTVERFVEQSPTPVDLIIADPPRGGLEKIASQFTFAPEMLLISCHLPSAVRDLKNLTAIGWQIIEITPYDMFAQTAHVELLTRLRRT